MTNRGVGSLLRGVDPDLLAAPNAYRIGLHPGGLLPRVREPAGWIAHLGHRLERALRWSGDPRLAALQREVRGYPGVAEVLDADPTRARRSCCSPSPSPIRTVTSPSTRP